MPGYMLPKTHYEIAMDFFKLRDRILIGGSDNLPPLGTLHDFITREGPEICGSDPTYENFYKTVSMRISHIMLEVQRATEFPIHIKLDRSTFKIHDKDSADLFSLGMMAAFDGKEAEKEHEDEDA